MTELVALVDGEGSFATLREVFGVDDATPWQVPFFPNARYLAHRDDYEWITSVDGDEPYVRDNVVALNATGRLELVEDGAEPLPGVTVLRTGRSRAGAGGSCRPLRPPAVSSGSRISASAGWCGSATGSPGARRTRRSRGVRSRRRATP